MGAIPGSNSKLHNKYGIRIYSRRISRSQKTALFNRLLASDLAVTGVLHHQFFDVKRGRAIGENYADFSVGIRSNSFWGRVDFRAGSAFALPSIEAYEMLCTTGTCFQLTLVRNDPQRPTINRGNLAVYSRPFPGPHVSKAHWLWLAFASSPGLIRPSASMQNRQGRAVSARVLPFYEMGRPYQTGHETPAETIFQTWDTAAASPRQFVQLSRLELPPGGTPQRRGVLPEFHTNFIFDVQAITNLNGLIVPTAWRIERWIYDQVSAFQGKYVPQLIEEGDVTNVFVSVQPFAALLSMDTNIFAITDYRVQPPGVKALPADYLSSSGLLPTAEAEKIAIAASEANQLRNRRPFEKLQVRVAATILLVAILPLLLTGLFYFASTRRNKQTQQ